MTAATGDRPSGADGPHAFVDDLESPLLTEDDAHHLTRVLRLRRGDSLTVSDGAGSWRRCRLGEPIEVVGPVLVVPPVSPSIGVAFALVKGERPEWAVQKLTELGVDTIVPFRAARSVVQWDDERSDRQWQRFRRVAREASMQSRRVRLPEVARPTTFTDVAGWPGASLAVVTGGRPSLDHPLILVGPEGGWTDEEEAAALPSVALGPQVLRTETAAVAAGALLSGLREGLVSHVP